MKIVVFLGPSLCPSEARAIAPEEVEWRPPARRGDVYRALKAGATIVGLVDGAFGTTAAVQHRELLLALHRGCHIVGAGSMGALRAVELQDYGMEGVGSIFEDFAAGRLESDDEVAVIHAPAELHFAALSEPLVNVRYSLANAAAAGVSSVVCQRVLDVAASIFFADRTWPRILKKCLSLEPSESIESECLSQILQCRVNQKAADARALLVRIAKYASGTPLPPRRLFDLHDTQLFADFRLFEANPLLQRLR